MIRLKLILWALLSIPLLVAADDNCDKAKEYYREGVKLLAFEKRKVAFEKAVKLCPTYAEACNNLADAYENLGEFEQAEKYYKKAITIKPDLVVPWLGLGELYLKSARYQDSYNAFAKGLEIRPEMELTKAGLTLASKRVEQGMKFVERESIILCVDPNWTNRFKVMGSPYFDISLREKICIPSVYFELGSTHLTSASRKQLIEIGKALESVMNERTKLLILGHADSTGSAEFNLDLSRRRSEIIRAYLVDEYKLDAKSFSIKFFGQTWPAASNNSKVGRSQNRRVDMILE